MCAVCSCVYPCPAQEKGPIANAPGGAEARSFVLALRSRRFKRDHGADGDAATKVATASHVRGPAERVPSFATRFVRDCGVWRPCFSVVSRTVRAAAEPQDKAGKEKQKEEAEEKPTKDKKDKEKEKRKDKTSERGDDKRDKKERDRRKDKTPASAPKPKRPKLVARDSSDDDSDGARPVKKEAVAADKKKEKEKPEYRLVKR